jgi:archaemetzincin
MKYFYAGATPDAGEDGILPAVVDRIADTFGVVLKTVDLPGMDFAFEPARGQYASIPVLEMLARRCPQDALKLLALTGRDLFIPVLTFVYGHAQLGGRVAVVSLARLRQEFYGMAPNREIYIERAVKEAIHETGHMFGLVHCADRTCAMSLSTNIRQIDLKRAALCEECARRI